MLYSEVHCSSRSGLDKLFPSREEADRLRQVLQKCQVRVFAGSGHTLFLVHKCPALLYETVLLPVNH